MSSSDESVDIQCPCCGETFEVGLYDGDDEMDMEEMEESSSKRIKGTENEEDSFSSNWASSV